MTEEASRTALHAWRTEEVRSGNVDSQLPSVADLDRIAKLSESSREALRALPLRRKVAEQFVGPILEVLREVDGPGARAGASGRGAAAREGTVAPAGEAARRGAPPTAAPRDESAVEPEGFAPLDLSRGLADEAAQLVSATVADEAVRLSWPARPGHTVVYRVVAEDGGRKPFSPDSGMAVGATRTTHVLDSRPMTEAVRWVQVWAYEGSSVAAAKAAQPVLHAAGAVVAPVADVQLKESQGIVSAAWIARVSTQV